MKNLIDAIKYEVAFVLDHYHLPPRWVPQDKEYRRQWLKLALNSRYPLQVGSNYSPLYDPAKTKKIMAPNVSAQLKLLAELEMLP